MYLISVCVYTWIYKFYLTRLFSNNQYACSFGDCLSDNVHQPNGNRFCMVNFDSFELAYSKCQKFGCDTIAKYEHQGRYLSRLRNQKQHFKETQWDEHKDHYLSKHTRKGKLTFSTLEEAQSVCMMLSIDECAGVTQTKNGFQPRQGSDGKRASTRGEISFLRRKIEAIGKSSVFLVESQVSW